jgi:protein phosphatase
MIKKYLEVFQFPLEQSPNPSYVKEVKPQRSENKTRDYLNITYTSEPTGEKVPNLLVQILMYYPEYKGHPIMPGNIRPKPLPEIKKGMDEILKCQKYQAVPFVEMYNTIPGKYIVFGDIHGSVHSLTRSLLRFQTKKILNGFKLKEEYNIVFLGDLVDKGQYGYETLYLVLRLKKENPKNVYVIRGNHDSSVSLNRYTGFKYQLSEISEESSYKYILNCISRFPAAIFFRSNNTFIQMCHGGFAEGFDTSKLSVGLSTKSGACPLGQRNTISSQEEEDFQWSDFGGDSPKPIPNIARNAGKVWSSEALIEYTKKNNISLLLRGHQDKNANFKIFTTSNKLTNNLEKMELSLPKRGEIYAIKITDFDNKNYNNVFTFTTATQPYDITSDGYGILTIG